MSFLLALQAPPVVRVFIRLWDQALLWFDTAPLWQLGLAALLPSLVVSTAIRRHLAEVSGNPVWIRLSGKSFRMREVFTHFYITGRVGSGKTRACINGLLFQVFKRVPNWGGCVLDDKGDAHKDLSAFAAHAKRENDVVVLQSRPPGASASWTPTWTWNPLLDTRFPDSTHAEALVRTSNSVRRAESKEAFWEPTAILHITRAITALRIAQVETVSIANVLDVLTEHTGERLGKVIVALNKATHPEAPELVDHFLNRYMGMEGRLLDNIRGTISAYLGAYCEPALREIFCARDSTFEVAMVDAGKIVCCSISPIYTTGRRLYSALLKNMICEHANLRFTLSREEQAVATPLFLWMDEAQMLVSADPQKGDHTYAALLRQARLAFIMATQDPELSFVPALGKEIANALKLNLSNQIHLQAASPEAARWIADLVGKREIRDVNTSTGPHGVTRSRSQLTQERYWITPEKLRQMKPYRAVIRHSNGSVTTRPVHLPPVMPDGSRG